MRLDGYEKILKQISTELVNYLVQQGANREVAQDVVQDVFVKVLEMDLILPPNKIRPYMYQMAKRKYIDYYRRRKRFYQILERYLIPQVKENQPPVLTPSDERIGNLLNQLSDRDKQILKMKYLDQYSVKQVAEVMGKSQAAVKMILYRIKHRLRRVLGDKQNGRQ